MRRPLIVITPKSLLRLPEAASDLSELTNGSFNCIIGDDLPTEKIKRVVLCSGKVCYDLKKARDEKGISDVALLRLEQLYPFPYFEVEEMLKVIHMLRSLFGLKKNQEIKEHGLVIVID